MNKPAYIVEEDQKEFLKNCEGNMDVLIHSVPQEKGKYIVAGTNHNGRGQLHVHSQQYIGFHSDIAKENGVSLDTILGGGVMIPDKSSGLLGLVGESKDFGPVYEDLMTALEPYLIDAYKKIGINLDRAHKEPMGWYRQ